MIILNDGFMCFEFIIFVRGFIGFRFEFLIDIKGNGIMNYVFYDYMLYVGDIFERNRGVFIVFEIGEVVIYGFYNV